MLLKDWLTAKGVAGAEKIACKCKVSVICVYRWASGDRKPNATRAIEIHRATNGEVSYKEAFGNQKAQKTWPVDMFVEIDDWRKNV